MPKESLQKIVVLLSKPIPRVYSFSMGIDPKLSVIVQVKFELAFYDVAVRYFIRYVMDTPSVKFPK